MASNQFQIFQHTYYRRFLQQEPMPAQAPATANHQLRSDPFDANIVMVLSILLCALICSLGLNSIVRCALRCSRLAASDLAGLANTGVKKKALKTFPVVNFSGELKLPGLDSECVICLSEFVSGERVRILPKCNHGFHLRCIDKWLNSHSSCPTCRNCLIETCNKIVGTSGSRLPEPVTAVLVVAPPQETIVRIMPLEHEDVVHNY